MSSLNIPENTGTPVAGHWLDIDPHEIAKTKVIKTIVGGRVVYQAGAK